MSKFQTIEFYTSSKENYKLLPFKFNKFESGYILVNMVGEFLKIQEQDLKKIIDKKVLKDEDLYSKLISKHFIIDDESDISKELLSIKLKTRYKRLDDLTGLHIFVVSLRCEHSCPYCQVSRHR